MKYNITNVTIPQGKRKEINDKILYVIDNKLNVGITPEIVFNTYTGDGGLHGISFSDYNSFYEYTEAKKEVEQGQFFTPHHVSKFIVDCIRPTKTDLIADLTCGMGNFFNYLPVESNIYGTELDVKAYKVAKYLYTEANINNQDIRHYNPGVKFDLVLGNPPFNLKWEVGNNEYISQLYYCLKAAELLKPGGLMSLIVPSSFMADDFTDSGIIKEIDNRFNFIYQVNLPSNVFKSTGVDNFKTKIMFFQRKSEFLPDRKYEISLNSITELDNSNSEFIYKTFIKSITEQKESIRAKLFYENLHSKDDNREFQDKVKKYLYDIKVNKHVKDKYNKCLDYVNKFYNQEKPKDMDWKEWDKIKVTEGKVLSYLRRTLKDQHKREQDKIELVKTDFGLRLKGYSRKNKLQLSKYTGIKEMSFNDMVLNNDYPFNDRQFLKLFNKKVAEYKRQNLSFKSKVDNSNMSYLQNFSKLDNSTGEILQLNSIQLKEMNKILTKRYSILNFEMGGGKTLCSIAWYEYQLQKNNIRNVFIISAALAINLTWAVKLKDYDENFIQIKSLKDINNIKHGQIVIMSFDMLIKYQRQIKKYIKQQSQKVALVVDESDELSNYTSKRTRATLNCFRKVKYKLLATGTTTRNNINELYPQLELLYNNSVNMICECKTIQKEDKKTKELKEIDNKYYMKPFPAHHGQSLFKACFSPSKATVFGVKKENQDIYNIDSLQRLIEKTIITRKFKEIVGEDKYTVVTHRIKQNEAEKEVYERIMKEFYTMLHYFRSTGNSKKDSMLQIIRQIQLLIKSTSIPHKMKEYVSDKLPNKYNKIFSMLDKFKDEKVAIGTVYIESAEDYYFKVSKRYPERQVFIIKGEVSFNKRKSIIKEFEASTNGILISTQQSLKSSVNIPSCNKVIVESLQWNLPKMSQYYFRFIRFNSKEFKEIHFVTYDNTIEQNLLALLMTKERINEYIKTLDFKDQSEVFEEYGIDLSILDSVIEKEKDEEGRVRLTWGKQKFV